MKNPGDVFTYTDELDGSKYQATVIKTFTEDGTEYMHVSLLGSEKILKLENN